MSEPADPAGVPAPVVNTTIDALAQLMETNPVALYEAVEMARDRTHVPFGNTTAILEEFGLLEDGAMRGATRDAILAYADSRNFPA